MKGSRMTLRHEKIQHLPARGREEGGEEDYYYRLIILSTSFMQQKGTMKRTMKLQVSLLGNFKDG